ncbi:ATP-grasp domain-containing protein [Leptospira sp. 96542]|nr:ATP-grasp domain-containing protein [Leptospira sp. 96542]
MKKLTGSYLSIGAGANQIPLIKAAKERGLKVIAVDKNPSAPGFIDSDIKILESTHEYRKILHAMSQVPLPYKLLGVGTRSFGKATYTTSYLAEKLKLKGNPVQSVSLFLNKEDVKGKVLKVGVPTPIPYTNLRKLTEKKPNIQFPVITKPKNGSGKMGIQVFETESEFKKFSKLKVSDSFLMEPFVEGEEVTVLGFVISSKFYLISITDKITKGKPSFVEIAHIAPSKHLDMAGELKMLCQAITKATKLKTGAFVAEFIITKNKECHFIEAAPEVGGEFLADTLIPYHYGYNYFKDFLSVTIGEKTRPEFLANDDLLKKKSALVFVLPNDRQKKVKQSFVLKPEFGETVFFEKQLIPVGSSLDGLEGNHRRTQVFGISTKQNVQTETWLLGIQGRLDL